MIDGVVPLNIERLHVVASGHASRPHMVKSGIGGFLLDLGEGFADNPGYNSEG